MTSTQMVLQEKIQTMREKCNSRENEICQVQYETTQSSVAFITQIISVNGNKKCQLVFSDDQCHLSNKQRFFIFSCFFDRENKTLFCLSHHLNRRLKTFSFTRLSAKIFLQSTLKKSQTKSLHSTIPKQHFVGKNNTKLVAHSCSKIEN